MTLMRPYANALELLRTAGCGRPGRDLPWRGFCSRRAIGTSAPSSCTARRQAASVSVSLATVYNTLHQFVAAGLLREVVVDPGRSYFDTNTADHHHFFFEESGRLHGYPERPCRRHRTCPSRRKASITPRVERHDEPRRESGRMLELRGY